MIGKKLLNLEKNKRKKQKKRKQISDIYYKKVNQKPKQDNQLVLDLFI